MRWFRLICCGLAVVSSISYAQSTPKVNADSLVGKNFTDRVSAYVALRKSAQSKVNPQKPTNSADTLDSRDKLLTQELKAARQGAKQGEMFTPEAVVLFRKLVASSFNSSDGAKVRASLRHAEPVSKFALKINEDYPSTVPVQSMPPSVLMNLPQLPKEVEYRIVGRDLILLDVGTNLVVDIAPNVVPSS
jgi:hypothetical protein